MNNKLNVTKKTCLLFAAVAFAMLISFVAFPKTAHAGSEGLAEPIYANDGSLYPVVDYADLLTDDEEQQLANRIYEIQEQYQSAIVILTVDSTGSRTATEYADDFYDYNGYGYGPNHDGTIFIIAMEDRSYWMSTTGSAIGVYTDSDIEYICDECVGYLSSGNYYTAFLTFVDNCRNELDSKYRSGIFTPGKFVICLIIGLVLALIPLLIFISQLLTVHRQSGAAVYSRGGINLREHSDRYIRSTISKTKIPKDNGGSSTHSGSSGTSHGGGGGHF